ncbi:hypothetical protein KU43P_11390 [Pseudomonas sp. KU43P]|nr:hypothetical protein KU43P_11390 [Pseudomonas sp. KU43P]
MVSERTHRYSRRRKAPKIRRRRGERVMGCVPWVSFEVVILLRMQPISLPYLRKFSKILHAAPQS